MTDHQGPADSDDALRARLRAGDPAADLPPTEPGRVARVLEVAMSTDTRTESRETGTRHRSPLTWLVAAAAVVLIATAAGFALLGRGEGPGAPPVAQEPPTVTELTMPDAAASRCMVPHASVLGHAATAVDAEVASISGGVVTLDVSRWYAGEETEQVTVDQSAADRQALLGAPEFTEGERYLVAATSDQQVMVCGFSGRWTERLAGLYGKAFGTPGE